MALRHPHIAHHVRRLTLSSNWLESNMYVDPLEDVTLRTTIAWSLPFDLGRFIDPIARRVSDVKLCNTLMKNTIIKFRNVSSLVIVEGPCSFSQTKPCTILVNAYRSCYSSLRMLSLITTSANLKALFPFSNASRCTFLEEVTLSFSPQSNSSDIAEAVSAFFQAIAATLTTLNISFSSISWHNSLRLLQSLFSRHGDEKLFPKLARFSLSHSDGPLTSSNPYLFRFLNQHADTLKYLHLQHTVSSSFASDDFDQSLIPVLPHLETLNILNGSSSSENDQELSSSEGLNTARVYIQHSGSALTSLGLTHCFFNLHDLGLLLDLLVQKSSESNTTGGLKSLTVTVKILSPQVLDMLAEKLPQLERLMVHFADLKSNDTNADPTWTTEGSRAGLRDLTLEVCSRLIFVTYFYVSLIL